MGKVISINKQDPKDRLSWIPISKYKPKSEGLVMLRVADDKTPMDGLSAAFETNGRYVEGFMCSDQQNVNGKCEVFLPIDRILYWKPIEEGDK